MGKGMVGILSALTGAGAGALAVGKIMENNVANYQQLSDKHYELFRMMNQWVRVKQTGKNLSEYLLERGYQQIAIYGLSYVGETLIEELKDTQVCIRYAVDRSTGKTYGDIKVVAIEDTLESVDVVIVTAITYIDEITEAIKDKFSCPIISLEDIVYSM